MIGLNDLRLEVRNVVRFCANECERQQTGPVAVADMLDAYAWLLGISEEHNNVTWEHVIILGYTVDHKANMNGIRTTPVTFANGGSASKPEHIERQLCLLLNEQAFVEPKEWVKRFLEIHPFADGNGRVAALLYNFLRRDLYAPQPLPEFQFV